MIGMRRLALGMGLVLTAALSVLAQDGPPPGGGPPGGGRGGRGGPPGGGRGGMMSGMMSRWIGGSLDELQKELSLTDDQKKKIEEIANKTGETIRAKFEEARSSGNWQSLRGDIEKLGNEALEQVKGSLTPEQQEKFTKMQDERRSRWESYRRDRGSRGGSRFGGTPEQRADRVMEELKIENADEAAAIKALIAKVAKLQDDLRSLDRTTREKAGELLKNDGMADEAFEERLQGFRTERKKLEKTLEAAQDELRKVVTARQEIVLFRQGLVR